MTKDYVTIYKIERTTEIAKSLLTYQNDLRSLVNQTMDFEQQISNYTIIKTDNIILGRNPGCRCYGEKQNLIITDSKNHYILSLGFSYDLESIIIKNIQTPYNSTNEHYNIAKEELQINPHELILAHFLARLNPVLGIKPSLKVKLDYPVEIHKDPECEMEKGIYRLYKSLVERFFEKGKCPYMLNPKKTRVLSIFGKAHPWIIENLPII